ncbi:MAG: class I SAM-dependent methyltransferase, partial [Flavobacteriales bacterium]|nr:class I SAM-dependent methyltransferase [Flavobacteriales bacterium]
MGWFTRWFGTRYYSLLYGHRDAGEALAWVEAILGRWELGVGAEVLDLACGRGRHTRLFADRGMKMTGVDISRTSIEEARKQVPEASLFVHDMREPLAENAFDAACCLFTSLGYFDDREDDHRVFRAVFGCLRPGGRFVVDFMNTERVLRELVPEEKLVREGVTFEIT